MNAAHLHVVDPELERLWDAYVAARHVVDQTNDFADAVAAGMAWKAFLDAFLADDHFNRMPGGSPSTGV